MWAGRGCADKIFILRTTVGAVTGWNSSLFFNYIDFQKAFDSIYHPSLWRISEAYAFKSKVVNILNGTHADNMWEITKSNNRSTCKTAVGGLDLG